MRECLCLVVVAVTVGAACEPRIADGRYTCKVADPGSCPEGFFCQVRAGDDEPRCYSSAAPGVCGDGKVDPGEACDGTVATTCHALGYWHGTPRCSASCTVDESGCVPLVSVSVGPTAACGLDGVGVAWCWGDSYDRLLGDGSLMARVEPRPVSAPEALVEVRVGLNFACGLADTGVAWCWGQNGWGAFGPGAPLEPLALPWAVDTRVRFVSLAPGWTHLCGLDTEGQIWCWGDNWWGQLGDGTRVSRQEPTKVEVEVPTIFVQVVAGAAFTCGLDDAGQAWCWGVNLDGRLGDGSEVHEQCGNYDCSTVPVAVASEGRLSALSAYTSHSCGLDDADHAWCWGDNDAGQLGDGTTESRSIPTRVVGDQGFTTLSTGLLRTSALDAAGTAWSWGLGAIGDGERDGTLIPAPAVTEAQFTGVSAGVSATCGLTVPGGLACWGFDGAGHLGQPSAGRVPRRVITEEPFEVLAAGWLHSCGLDAAGRAWCWGGNGYYQLGSVHGWTKAPQPVEGDAAFGAIVAGGTFSAALDLEGHLWTWGFLPTTSASYLMNDRPTPADPTAVQVALTAGMQHVCVLDATGLAACWGDNTYGQLGTGGEWSNDGPLPVSGDHRFARLSAGFAHTCGVDLDGVAWCWGNGSYGQLGDGSFVGRNRPITVQTEQRFVDLACGGYHCCGLDAAGTSWCWGMNVVGELGSGWPGSYAGSPQQTRSTRPFRRIVAGAVFVCALDEDDQLWCWGGGQYGYEVPGPPGAGAGFIPTRVTTDLRFVDLAAGANHACARETAGDWTCWGSNPQGQLGIDDHLRYPTPVTGPELP